MTIRTKLTGAFLLMALVVAALGWITVSRVNSIDAEVADLSQGAVPTLLMAQHLDELQREQELALLTYANNGNAEERQRYTRLSKEFDEELSTLAARVAADEDGAGGNELLRRVSDERTKFLGAAAQILGNRTTVDRNLTELRARNAEIVADLSSIRRRFLPGAAAGATAGDAAAIPQALRTQVNDLLLGTEGMLRVVSDEFALATGYTITPNETAQQQFEAAGGSFNNWLQLAYAAGGPEDRAILVRVQEKFFKQFEPSARSMLLAADSAAKSRTVFTEASAGISGALDEIVEVESARMLSARSDAEGTAGSTRTIVIAVTVLAIVLAGVLGAVVAGSIIRPLVHLRDVADRISRGDVADVEVDVAGTDEVGDLAAAFRRMTASIRFLMARTPVEEGDALDVSFAPAEDATAEVAPQLYPPPSSAPSNATAFR